MAFCRQGCSNSSVIRPGFDKIENSRAHFNATFQPINGRYSHRYGQFRDQTSTPDDPHSTSFMFTTIENHLIDETAQQRLASCLIGGRIMPDFREPALDPDDLVAHSARQHEGRNRLLGLLTGESRLGSTHVVERRLPTSFQLGGDQAIVRIDLVELPFRHRGFVALALQLLFQASAGCRS